MLYIKDIRACCLASGLTDINFGLMLQCKEKSVKAQLNAPLLSNIWCHGHPAFSSRWECKCQVVFPFFLSQFSCKLKYVWGCSLFPPCFQCWGTRSPSQAVLHSCVSLQCSLTGAFIAARKELRGYQSRNGALLGSPPAPWRNLLSPQVVPSICQRVC